MDSFHYLFLIVCFYIFELRCLGTAISEDTRTHMLARFDLCLARFQLCSCCPGSTSSAFFVDRWRLRRCRCFLSGASCFWRHLRKTGHSGLNLWLVGDIRPGRILLSKSVILLKLQHFCHSRQRACTYISVPWYLFLKNSNLNHFWSSSMTLLNFAFSMNFHFDFRHVFERARSCPNYVVEGTPRCWKTCFATLLASDFLLSWRRPRASVESWPSCLVSRSRPCISRAKDTLPRTKRKTDCLSYYAGAQAPTSPSRNFVSIHKISRSVKISKISKNMKVKQIKRMKK